jgi:hypothetical protein
VSVAAVAPAARDVTNALEGAGLRVQTTGSAVAGRTLLPGSTRGSERLWVRAAVPSAMADAPIGQVRAGGNGRTACNVATGTHEATASVLD